MEISKENCNPKKIVEFIINELSYKQVKEIYKLLYEEIVSIEDDGWD